MRERLRFAPSPLVSREAPPGNPCYQSREREPIGLDTSQWPSSAHGSANWFVPASGAPCRLDPWQAARRPGTSSATPTLVLTGCSEGRGLLRSDALCSLRRERDPVRLLLPKLRAEARSRASLRSAALPRELCISNLLRQVQSTHVACELLRADGGSIPLDLVLRFL